MKIVFHPVAVDIMVELVAILYYMKYFSYEYDAQEYVDNLSRDIEKNLPMKQKKRAPHYFETKYGTGLYYAIFKKNKRTSWYVFFHLFSENEELIYKIVHITNNHVDAKYFE